MGLFEKVAWYNFAALVAGAAFYSVIGHSISAIPDYSMAFLVLISSSILVMLCNFAWIIYFEKENNLVTTGTGAAAGKIRARRIDLHLIYWGAFGATLVVTWLQVRYGAPPSVPDVLPPLALLGFFFAYTAFFNIYKKRRAESIVPEVDYSTAEILLQKVLPGHDERDLIIRNSARKHSLIILFFMFCIGAVIAILLARMAPEDVIVSIHAAHILLFFAGVMYLRHMLIQISTIIQYRRGR